MTSSISETVTQPVRETHFCSLVARQRGIDPAGYGGTLYNQYVILEVPTPWPLDLFSKPGLLPIEALKLVALMREDYARGKSIRIRPLVIAPDPEYSRRGFRRVLYYERPHGPFATYKKRDYLVPEAEAGSLIWALARQPGDLPRFERFLQPTEGIRELLICTHGSVDAACAKFGYPLYRRLRDHYADYVTPSGGSLRAWRVSHFGGHIFAPTLIDLPEGRYWAFVEEEEAEFIVRRNCTPQRLRGHYRGWSGLDHGFEQVAEREMWLREGWAWFDYLKQGYMLAKDAGDEPEWADVRVDFTSPDGRVRGAYEAHVEVSRHVETEHTSGHAETYPYPQHEVTHLKRV